jgi:polyisoprenoid-binding protein YceI
MSGHGRVASEGAEKVNADAEALLEITVRSFDCGNARMNSDLFDALKADVHPTIHFKMESADVVGYRPSGSVELDVVGIITVAGVTRSVQTRVVGDRLATGQLRAAGAILVSMRDFSIEPPTALLGLVRTRNDITVRFDLVAATSTGVSMVGSGHAN